MRKHVARNVCDGRRKKVKKQRAAGEPVLSVEISTGYVYGGGYTLDAPVPWGRMQP